MVVHDCVWRGGHVRLHGGSWLCVERGACETPWWFMAVCGEGGM